MPRKRTIEHVLPASNPKFIQKAAESDAEILFLDLEDAVATSVKVATRKILVDAVKTTDFRGKEIYIRPNNLRTKWSAGDYYEVVRAIGNKVTGVTLPKTVGLEDIKIVDGILTAIEAEQGWKRGSLKLEVLIELPTALLEVDEIAKYIAACGRAGSLIFGLVDYTAATGGRPQAQEDQFLYPIYPKKKIIAAAARWGLDSFDGVTIHVKNYEATKQDAISAAKLGFTGKWSLHPEQIRAIHDGDQQYPFAPSRIEPKAPIKMPPASFSLEQLKQLASESKPILPPLEISKKQTKARRSVWVGSKESAPKEVDDCAVAVISVSRPEDVAKAVGTISGNTSIFVKLETPQALDAAYVIAKASPRIEGLIFDMPGKRNDFEAKGALIAACSAADVDAIDGPALSGQSQEEAKHDAILGFAGKVALTSQEAQVYNQIFSPPVEAIERALEIVELYHKADVERGLGAIVYVDPRRPNAQEELVDAATVKVERRVLAVAEKAKLFTPEQTERYRKLTEGSDKKENQKNDSRIKSVSILGAGEIGAPLAARMARCGVQVHLATLHLDTLARAEKKIRASLEFKAKDVTGILPLEKKLAKAVTPEEKATFEAKIKELEPQMKELRNQWLTNVKTAQDSNYLNLVKILSESKPDMIIECTREELLTKQAILRAWTKELDDSKMTIVTTTSSSLLVSEIADYLPERYRPYFIDFHPFNPPDRMDLLEIAYTKETDKTVVLEAVNFAKTLGLEPVLVKDSCGLIVNRILFAYLGEAVNMLIKREASLEQIIQAAFDFGLPMDPFRLLDFVGVDVSEAIIANLHGAFSHHIQPANPFFKRLLGQGRYGNKTKKGFYSYQVPAPLSDEQAQSRAKELRVDAADIKRLANLGLEPNRENLGLLKDLGMSFTDCERLAALLAKGRVCLDREILQSYHKFSVIVTGVVEDFDPLRLALVMANEAARIVEEGIATAADVDLAMDLGTKFPESRGLGVRIGHGLFGLSKPKNKETLRALYAASKNPKMVTSGPLGWALNFGVEEAVTRLDALSRLYGTLYKPSDLLLGLCWNHLPKADAAGKFRTFPYKKAVVKPRGVRGPAPEIFEEGMVPAKTKLGAYQLRGSVIAADINANWKWGVRDYPIDLARYHQESGTVGGSAGLVLVTEVGNELSSVGSIQPGDIGIMLSGKHDVITTEALGGSAQAHRSFRIHAYEAKDAFEGSYSQEVVLDWSQFVKVDEGVYNFEDLGCVGLVYPTVQHALHVLATKKEDVLLIEGAVGGTGSAAVMTAKLRQTKVIGLVSSEERGKKAMQDYGADTYINRKNCETQEDYLNTVKTKVQELTGEKKLLDKVLAYSGAGMFARHVASVREADAASPSDIGGEVAYFGAGETGFALEAQGTAGDTPIVVMFDRLSRVRRERYYLSTMRHVLIVGQADARTREAIEEAKRRHCDVIVVVKTNDLVKEIEAWNLLAKEGWRKATKSRDGIISLEALGVAIERMPDFPSILPDQPTAQELADYEAKSKTYQAYMRRSLIPLGKAIGNVWGMDATGRPICPDVDFVFWGEQDGANILNYLMFSGFFTQIAYPNDTASLKLRWHAGLGWMNQNSIVLSRKAILGTHYASPAESTAIVDWIMRGIVKPVETVNFMPRDIGVAQESIGTGKNAILTGVSRSGLKTLAQAYEAQEVDRLLRALEDKGAAVRTIAARELYDRGCRLVSGVLHDWQRVKELEGLIFGPPTVGVAVNQKRFERLRAIWGDLDLAPVPEEHQVNEFTLHEQGSHLDIITHKGGGAIAEFLAKHGEGIQQVELWTSDIETAIAVLRKLNFKPVYEKSRLGSHGTLVNFILAPQSNGKKVLVELVQLAPGVKFHGRKRIMEDLDIRVFAKASGDRNTFHLDDEYAKRSRYKTRIAHGVLTASLVLSDLGDTLACVRLDSVEVSKFITPVRIGDCVIPEIEIARIDGAEVDLKLSALNQEGTALFEGLAKGKIIRSSPVASLQSRGTLKSWAQRWSHDVEAFASRPAPAFKVGDVAKLSGMDADSKALLVTQESLLAYSALFGPSNPHLHLLVGIGAIAHTSAMFAPGYILLGFKVGDLKRSFKAGDLLVSHAKVSDVTVTKSAKTVVKITTDITDDAGASVLLGEVTKIKAEETANDSAWAASKSHVVHAS